MIQESSGSMVDKNAGYLDYTHNFGAGPIVYNYKDLQDFRTVQQKSKKGMSQKTKDRLETAGKVAETAGDVLDILEFIGDIADIFT